MSKVNEVEDKGGATGSGQIEAHSLRHHKGKVGGFLFAGVDRERR